MTRRYLIGFIIAAGLIVLLIFLIFGGGKPTVPSTQQSLDSYSSSNSEVSMTIDGPINADQNHEQVKVIVSATSATFEQIQGYQGNVAHTQSYPNNVNAYTNFLFALEGVNFTKGNSDPKMADERGYCPLGTRYIFELDNNGSTLERFWTTDCGGTHTYGGITNATIQLFENQIPDYSKLTTGLTNL